MKKIISMSLIVIMICLCFVGCAKCIGTETSIEQVEIIDTYHRGAWIQPLTVGKVHTFIHHPAVYQVIVFYNDVEYTVNGEEAYDKYKESIGKIVNATIEKNSYDDGTVKYSVVELE